ncbi:MAG: insulinase family protein [Clostridiales bacterium]|nr:insulinase family protein [Clostridiales bacterium]
MQKTVRTEISPGVWLRVISTNKFIAPCFSISFLTTLEKEKAANFALLPNLLRRGCKKYPDMEKIAFELNALYGARIEPYVRKKGAVQCVGFVCDMVSDQTTGGEPVFRKTLMLLSEILLRPYLVDSVFDSNYVAGERANLVDRIEAQINDKRTYAKKRLFEIMCENEPFGLSELGDIETAKKIDAKTAYSYYEEMLSSCQIEIFYCGNENADTVEHVVRESLGSLRGINLEKPNATPPAIGINKEQKNITETMAVSQGKLALGFRTTITAESREYPALIVMNALFGGSTSSKLFLNVREKMSLCYYASSTLEKLAGIMAVSSGIEVQNFEIAKKEILKQLEAVKSADFNEEEFDAAKKSVLTSLKAILDSPVQLEDFELSQAVGRLPYGPEELIFATERVDSHDVVAAAGTVTLDTVYFLKGEEAK